MREEFYILLIIMIIGYVKLKRDILIEVSDIRKKIKQNDDFYTEQIKTCMNISNRNFMKQKNTIVNNRDLKSETLGEK